VRVLVIDHRVGVFALSVHPHENVVLVRRPQKKAAQLELPFCQVHLRFERTEVFLVLDGQHDDGRVGIDGQVRKRHMKNRAHALKLVRNAPSRLLVGVRHYGEMLTADFQPVLRPIARRCQPSREQG
jgi:hypothetical protein